MSASSTGKDRDREGLIEGDERQLAENVLTFGDRRVREIMVPRAESGVPLL